MVGKEEEEEKAEAGEGDLGNHAVRQGECAGALEPNIPAMIPTLTLSTTFLLCEERVAVPPCEGSFGRAVCVQMPLRAWDVGNSR